MAVRARRATTFPATIFRSEAALPLGLLAPTLIFLALLILLPVAQAVLLSFKAADGALGLDAYKRMFGDVAFVESFRNTILLLIALVPIQMALALAMALLINSRFKGHGIFLYIFALPLAISDLAAGIVWLSIFTENGYLNGVLQGLGLIKEPVAYLSYENLQFVFMAVVVAESWRATAIVLVILLAGLQVIPREFFEAAELFGANRWRRTLQVVLPMLKPSLQSALIIRTIFAFQTFAVVLALAGRQLPVLGYEAYDWYYNNRNESVAAAFAALILVLTITITIVYLRLLRVRDAELAR
ncbi:MAG: carbohydrate ABC transporter permease [Candidatus Limnocylindria bacterium]